MFDHSLHGLLAAAATQVTIHLHGGPCQSLVQGEGRWGMRKGVGLRERIEGLRAAAMF